MKRCLTTLFGLLLATMLLGCPFDAKVPLDAPRHVEIDLPLAGCWIWESPKDKSKSNLVVILPFNDSEYLVEVMEHGKETGRYRVYPVAMGGQVFWNINGMEESFPPTSFFFARHAVTADGQLSISFVGEHGVPESLANDAQGLRAHIESHLTDPALYDKDKGAPFLWRRPKAGEVERGRLKCWTE